MTTLAPTVTVRLGPGVHVVARDGDHVQVGLDPPARVIVRRDPDLLDLLDQLARGASPHRVTAREADLVRALDDAGLLERPEAARSGTVAVADHGLGVEPLVALLRRAGVGAPRPGTAVDLHVVAAPGPLPRDLLDGWVLDGTPHLVLAGTGRPGGLRLGPLVEPGTTACLRCVDAAESVHDPRRSLVLEQLAVRPAAPFDPALVTLALAWAAREVAAYVGGRRPLTWSATVDLGDDAPVVRTWERHPHCGCAWDEMPY